MERLERSELVELSINKVEERLFWVDSLPCDRLNCIYLSPEADETQGMRFSGGFPLLWDYQQDELAGPKLYDEDHTYRVTAVDYRHNNIWLEEV